MRGTRQTTMKALAVLGHCCWAAFFVQLVPSFLYGISIWWGFVPLILAVGLKGASQLLARPGGEPGPPVEVEPPVTGRWSALNSPADRVPSHGTHGYGQTYAIDVAAEPTEGARPAFGWWPVARRNRDFPAFGAPLLAVADGTVVRASDWRRDHLSRNSYPALAYLLVEGLLRDIAGATMVIGNHVVLDLGDGTYALYAHVRRGSLTVRPGDRVRAGQRLGDCGNSGNSSESHLHFQLMDTPDPVTARGVPFSWRGCGVPAGGTSFEIQQAPHPASPA
jgi:murein DD-endopeptidase MepM/ murein hydrolase activator NlpD